MDTKVCKECKVRKPIDQFYFSKPHYRGKYFKRGIYSNKCKICDLARHKKWANKNTQHLREYLRHLYHTNPDRRKACIKCSYHYRHDPSNKQHIRKNAMLAQRRLRKNPHIRILHNLRRRVSFVLKGEQKSANTLALIGCSRENLIKHLESQFKNNMSWSNYGRGGWNVDHIIPCCSFDLSNPEEQKKCFHYTNLQPLWWIDNYRKGSRSTPYPKWTLPFPPKTFHTCQPC